MSEKGFTLIEMLIVLSIISLLLFITVPNVASHNSVIQKKGCEGLQRMLEAQLQAYEIDKGSPAASLDMLVTDQYLPGDYVESDGTIICPDHRVITYVNGAVSIDEPTNESAQTVNQ
ncbi:prepilin-type N-terminal cleavage/methylation domain-containing protein [Bacillus sp. HMF5848]|uniref:competence type IV pilus major pilin ComGC n=1 Tax=Bacillus sp. HMF5848 TaxID=2495421 RepID=UPI000F78A1D7|nr:competence type IV pilus major pilin ComGC [Bacillus sp. HMF5848]RSK27829.1 prepilin-type N-terminal cleavage/methylation domain-containing protein [Bacillus sp. HMF5848]